MPLRQALEPKESRAGSVLGGAGWAAGRGQGGGIALSFLVTWALVRAQFFLDKSELRGGSVEMRTKQETRGAGNETDVGLRESPWPLCFPHRELGSCSFGLRWATSLQATPEDRAEAETSGMLPEERRVLQWQTGPESRIQWLGAGTPFACSNHHTSGRAPSRLRSQFSQKLALVCSETLKCTF